MKPIAPMFLAVSSMLAAFTAFSNFDSAVNFVGFFGFLIDNWRDVLAWIWKVILGVVGVKVYLNDIERVTITLTFLIFIPPLVAFGLARWSEKSVELNLSTENKIRLGVLPPMVFLTIMSGNLAFYQMSITAFWVELSVVAILAALMFLVAWPQRSPDHHEMIRFFNHMILSGFLIAGSITLVSCLYAISFVVSLAPRFP